MASGAERGKSARRVLAFYKFVVSRGHGARVRDAIMAILPKNGGMTIDSRAAHPGSRSHGHLFE
jgi:hypothetical protein